ncbi:MAG: GxxExxY protein [Betaproteobacteria bacterium]
MTLSRVPPALPPVVETLVERTIGACIEVHRQLGPGLLEATYSCAIGIELAARGIVFVRERSVPVSYRGHPIAHQRIDVVVDEQLILEVKSADCLAPIHVAQLISYLKLTRLHVGLLVNFNVPILKQGLRRIVL